MRWYKNTQVNSRNLRIPVKLSKWRSRYAGPGGGGGEKKACVGIGATGSMTMPFEGTTFKAAENWAGECWQSLDKCERCGELLPEEYWTDEFGDGKFCSEMCAEEVMRSTLEDLEEARKEYETACGW